MTRSVCRLFRSPRPRSPFGVWSRSGYDSFCAECFATVGSEQNEDALATHEAAHVCNRIHLVGGAYMPRFLLQHNRLPENETA
jgi:hypothetical protein